MYENLLNQLIILEFRKADGKIVRTIAWLRAAGDHSVDIESPTKHVRSTVDTDVISLCVPLPENQIDQNRLTK